MVELFRIVLNQRSDAHTALRKILSSYLGEAPEQIRFEKMLSGKLLHPKVFFSLSHSNNLALVAVSKDAPVGIDIEHVRRVPSKLIIAKRFFAPSESAYLESLMGEFQENAFFNLWTVVAS